MLTGAWCLVLGAWCLVLVLAIRCCDQSSTYVIRSCLLAAVLSALGYSIIAVGVSNPPESMTNSIPFLSTGFLLVG